MSEMETVASTRRTLLPVVGAVAAVTALAVGIAFLGQGADSGTLKKLALTGGAGAARDAALSSGSSGAPAGSGYVLVGTLPQGQPADAPVWELEKGAAPAGTVARLAHALEAGTPERQEGGWRAGGLFVSDGAGRSWWYAPCAADQPVSPDVRVGCAVATSGTTAVPPAPPEAPTSDASSGSGSGRVEPAAPAATPVPADGTEPAPAASPVPAPREPDPIPASTVRDAAKGVFAALGLDVADAKIQTWGHGGSATVSHQAGDLTATGFESRVDVDRQGRITNANGYLGDPDKGDAYPLVSAQEAFDALPPMMEMLALCPVDQDGKGCASPQPAEVTGARLGLMLQTLERDDLALVPAWLFEVKGWEQPVPVVAVEPEYLTTPDQPKDTPASTDPGAGGGTPGDPGDPGQTEPDPGASSVPPATAKPEPSRDPDSTTSSRTTVSFTEAWRTADPGQVRIRYYEDGCGWDNVTHVVKESDDTVVVLVEADARPADQACTAIATPVDRLVALKAPLGTRTLVDGASGRPVTVSDAP